MIRRNLPLGMDPQEWLLISQIEHARMSRTLAEHWGNGEVSSVICDPDESNPARLQVRHEVLSAINHHDDGWSEWEAAPTLDVQLGRPLDFMEMPQFAAIPIWEKSIRAALDAGPLAGWIVAGHFLALLKNSNHAIGADSTTWQARIENERTTWLNDWQARCSKLHTDGLANQSLSWLQMFDRLSLWLCCTCPLFPSDGSSVQEPHELQVPNDRIGRVRFKTKFSQAKLLVLVEPWPFDAPELAIVAKGNAVPAKHYGTTAELVAAYQPREMQWQLCPN